MTRFKRWICSVFSIPTKEDYVSEILAEHEERIVSENTQRILDENSVVHEIEIKKPEIDARVLMKDGEIYKEYLKRLLSWYIDMLEYGESEKAVLVKKMYGQLKNIHESYEDYKSTVKPIGTIAEDASATHGVNIV